MSNYKKFAFKIERKVKPSRVLFYVTINGFRISKTNFAFKYDAMKQLRHVADNYPEEHIANYIKKQQAA